MSWSTLQLDLVAADYQVIAPDLMGHGNSFKPEGSHYYHQEELFKTFEAWVEGLNLSNKISLVGHSLGGHLCLQYCLRHPEHVRGLTLIDPFYSPRQLSPAARFLFHHPEIGVYFLRRASYQKIQPVINWGASVNGRFSPAISRQITLDLKRAAPEILHLLPTVPDLSPSLAQVSARTLVIWGTRDLALLPTSFPPLVAALPNATFEVINGCGHQPHMSRPDLVNPLITEFINRNNSNNQTVQLR